MSAAVSTPVASFPFPFAQKLRSVPVAGAGVVTFGEFRLDMINQSLGRSGPAGSEKIPLTPKIFALLSYLVENAGRLLTHDELVDALWRGVHVSAEVLKRHVFSLRALLGDNPRNPRFIETLPRRGYQFIAQTNPEAQFADLKYGSHVQQTHSAQQLWDCFRLALAGQRQVVFITGEPGVENDFLINEFLGKAAILTRGVLAGSGQCVRRVENRGPYFPVLQALTQLCHGPSGKSVIQILATHAPTWLSQIPSVTGFGEGRTAGVLEPDPARMLREMGDALDQIASATPVVLVLEDLQWADPCTVDLISAIARTRTRAKLMLVGTYTPLEASAQHPLRALRPDLLVRHLCQEIELTPALPLAA